jgi:PIN domain nuclease of toxin-antitoxin system
MKLLLGTHVFIWSKTDDPRMTAAAWAALRDPANVLHLSAVSVAEMAIKHAAGKLKLDLPLEEFLATGMSHAQIMELPLRNDHAVLLQSLPMHHRDPFDRMLVAQAQVEELTLLTQDINITKYNVRTIW